jgi:hypothetical protein
MRKVPASNSDTDGFMYINTGAGRGSRTHNGENPQRILSPPRMPISPALHRLTRRTKNITPSNYSAVSRYCRGRLFTLSTREGRAIVLIVILKGIRFGCPEDPGVISTRKTNQHSCRVQAILNSAVTAGYRPPHRVHPPAPLSPHPTHSNS